jgi:hypothetical protein
MSVPEQKRSSSKPLLIGCGVVGLVFLLLCGGGFFFGFRLFQAGMERMGQDEDLARAWTPPVADATAETFAPPTVADYKLTASDEEGGFPALGLEQDGPHAVYQKGSDKVEVSVYRMDEAGKNAAFDEVIRRIDDDDRFGSHSNVRLPRSLRFNVNPPELHGVLWYDDGWLVFVRSATVTDLGPFLKAYVEALGSDEETEMEDVEPDNAEQEAAPAE